MADELLIRCPVCLLRRSVAKNIPVREVINCAKCGQSFEFQNALPDKSAVANTKADPSIALGNYTVVEEVGWSFWFLSLLLSLITILLVSGLAVDMRGTEFLWLYFFFFIALWSVSSILRWIWKDHIALSVVACLIFEAVAILRFTDGWPQGMRDFSGMLMMMVGGGVVFFVRAEHMSRRGDGSAGCSSGYGGCGGGCGGCGG